MGRSGANGQERMLETSLVQKDDWGCDGELIINPQVGRGSGIEEVSKEFWKQVSRTLRG